ncbi:MAG: hypothetical protein OK438_05245 [Thaumarchaeota archaeon]|nr:hypothetical protein [Nitrososphaerota archaeon]
MEGRLVNVRRLVALDITLHGPRFIMAEFGIGTPAIIAVGTTLTLSGPLILGIYLVLTGVNYLPLLIYTVVIVRKDSAQAEVAEDLARNKHLVRKYSVQQFLLFLPLVVFLMAVWQELGQNRVPQTVPM